MLGVLLAENGMFCRYAPVDAQRVIEYAYTAVSLRMVELVALVLKYCRLAQHGKAMGESFRDEKLPVIVFCQFHGDIALNTAGIIPQIMPPMALAINITIRSRIGDILSPA